MPPFDPKVFRLLLKFGIPALLLLCGGVVWLLKRSRAQLNPRYAYQEAIARGDLAAADQELTRCLNAEPDDVDLLFERARVRINLKRYDEAIADLKQGTALAPENSEFHYKLGVAYMLSKHPAEAVPCYSAAIRLQPDNATYRNFRGTAFAELLNEDAALEDFSAALQIDGKLLGARVNRTYLLNARRQYEAALADATQVLEQDPQQHSIWNLRGNIHLERKDYPKAIADYTQAIRLAPRNEVFYANRGNAYGICGKFEEAHRDLEKSLKLNSKSAKILLQRGWLFYHEQKFELALADFEAATQIDSRNGSAWVACSNVLVPLGLGERALVAAERACQLNHNDGLTVRGLARLATGNYDAGFRDLKDYQKLNPEDPLAANRIAWLSASLDRTVSKNPAEAVYFAELACQILGRRETGLLDTLAAAYADAGRFDDAVRTQTEAIQIAAADGIPTQKFEPRLELYRARLPYRAPLRDLI